MKKVIISIVVVCIIFLCGGCFFLPTILNGSNHVKALKSWSFQSNLGADDYSLFFGLVNDKEKNVAADVNVDIRIVNDAGEEVYSATRSVTSRDFGVYANQIAGEQYLANVRIPASDIKNGKSNNGTVYLTVYGDKGGFDEVNCPAMNCLPVADVELEAKDLPVELNVKGFDGSVESIIKITDVTYVYDRSLTPQLKITILGQKTFGDSSDYDIMSYKLYDSNGYLTDSGNFYLSNLSAGDKFKDDSIIIYDITPGEKYTLQFSEYSW